jgi:hypothetical protein
MEHYDESFSCKESDSETSSFKESDNESLSFEQSNDDNKGPQRYDNESESSIKSENKYVHQDKFEKSMDEKISAVQDQFADPNKSAVQDQFADPNKSAVKDQFADQNKSADEKQFANKDQLTDQFANPDQSIDSDDDPVQMNNAIKMNKMFEQRVEKTSANEESASNIKMVNNDTFVITDATPVSHDETDPCKFSHDEMVPCIKDDNYDIQRIHDKTTISNSSKKDSTSDYPFRDDASEISDHNDENKDCKINFVEHAESESESDEYLDRDYRADYVDSDSPITNSHSDHKESKNEMMDKADANYFKGERYERGDLYWYIQGRRVHQYYDTWTKKFCNNLRKQTIFEDSRGIYWFDEEGRKIYQYYDTYYNSPKEEAVYVDSRGNKIKISDLEEVPLNEDEPIVRDLEKSSESTKVKYEKEDPVGSTNKFKTEYSAAVQKDSLRKKVKHAKDIIRRASRLIVA